MKMKIGGITNKYKTQHHHDDFDPGVCVYILECNSSNSCLFATKNVAFFFFFAKHGQNTIKLTDVVLTTSHFQERRGWRFCV